MPTSYFLKNRLHLLTLLFFLLFIFGCAGGTEIGNPTYGATSGVAQKGPLQLGSMVTAQELDKKLSPTGRQYTYQINSDLGTFSPNTTKFTSQLIDLNATGYYYDEVTHAVSTGKITLNGISDLSENTVLNVNLLTTLTYQRIKKLVTTQGMSLAAARVQAENEVLAAFNIPNGSRYGNFSSLDISKGRDGDNILAAISSIFVLGNNAENVSEMIAKFQFDIAENGVLTDAALKATLAGSAQALDTEAVAANLNAKYASLTLTAADIANWIDQNGDGVVGKFTSQAFNTSTFTLPAFVVNQLAGLSFTVSAGQLIVNGSVMTGDVIIKIGDNVVVTPPGGTLPSGVITIYLKMGSINLLCVTFSPGPSSMTAARSYHTATQLHSGKLLVAGGMNGVSLASAELYNPYTNTWSAAGSMTAARSYHTATRLNDGKVLVVGGMNGVSLAGAELYDPYTNTWSGAGNMTTARSYHTATLLNNGKVLVVGGMNGVSLASAELYDPYTNTWSGAGSMTTARSYHTATQLYSGTILVAGGINGVSLASAELYDPTTNTWSRAGSMTTARAYHTAIQLYSSKVLVAGGSNGASLASAELYDPMTNTWSETSSLITARAYHTATQLYNGKVLVAGGSNEASLASAELYDSTTNTWSATRSLTTARSYHTTTQLTNSAIVVVGGSSNGVSLASVELFYLW